MRSLGSAGNSMGTALPTILAGAAAEYYAVQLSSLSLDYSSLVLKLEQHFEPPMVMDTYRAEWRSLSLRKTITSNPRNLLTECVDILVERIQKLYHGLNREKRNSDTEKRDVLYSATVSVKACLSALPEPKLPTIKQPLLLIENTKPDRTTIGPLLLIGAINANSLQLAASREAWFKVKSHQPPPTDRKFQTFLTEFEGSEEELNEDEELLEQMYATNPFDDDDDDDDDDDQKEMTGENVFASSVTITSNFFTSNAPALKEVAEVLANAATRHALVADQPDLPGSQAVVPAAKPADSCPEYSNIYISASRYCEQAFQGIMPDTGASGNLTAGIPQVKALLRLMPHLKVEEALASIVEFSAATSEFVCQ
ncbi:hypothetical protein MY3296_008320 [Beauveria thailandica]